MLSTAPALVKWINQEPLLILVYRMGFASLILLPFSLKKLGKTSLRNTLAVLGVSLVLAVHFWTWFAGIKFLSVGYTSIIFATNPIFTALLGIFFLKDHFSSRFVYAFLCSFLGIIIISLTSSTSATESFNYTGLILIVISSFLYALYVVMSKRVRLNMSNDIFTFFLNIYAFIFALLFCGIFDFLGEFSISTLLEVEMPIVIKLFFLALILSVLGHALMVYSLPFLNINIVSNSKMVMPVLSSLWGILFFKDQVNLSKAIGLSLILFGLFLIIPRVPGKLLKKK